MPARAPLFLHATRDDYRRLGPAERRLWRWPMMWLAAAVITAAPLGYAVLSLAGALDPSGHLDTLPVALVNLDQGAVIRGQRAALGRDLLRDLTATPKFRYTIYATEDAAQNAVRRGDASFALTIPQTFTRFAAAGSSAQHGTLNVYVAGGPTTFAGRVATAFSDDLAAELNATLGSTRWSIVQRTLVGAQQQLTALRSATDRLTDGATQLKIGTRQLAYGAGTLAASATQAAGESRQLVRGAATLSGSVTRLGDRTGRLATDLKTLEAATPGPDQLSRLRAGATRVAAGTGQLTDDLGTLAGSAGTLSNGAGTAAGRARQLGQGSAALAETLPAVLASVEQLAGTAARVAASARAASADATRLSAGARQLAVTLPDLQGRLTQLTGSAAQLAASAATLDTGARTLTPADPALPALQSGLVQVSARARQFSVSAGTFAQQLARMNATLRTQFLVPQAVREDVAALAAQAERVRADSVLLRARLDQLGAPLRRAAGSPAASPVAAAPLPAAGAATLSAARAGVTAAAQQARALSSGAGPLATRARTLTTAAGQLTTQAGAARSGAAAAVQGVRDLGRDATDLAGRVQGMQTGAAALAGRATRAAADARSVQGDAGTLQAGVSTLADSTVAFRASLARLRGQLPGQGDLTAVTGGARTLATTSGTLGQTLAAVASGATDLQRGASDVNVGAGRLLADLTSLQGQIPPRLDALTGDPARLNVSVAPAVQTFAPVRTDGAALAPAVVALSLWMGVTLTTFIFPYQQLPRSGRRSAQLARVLRKATVPAALVAAQAVLVLLGVHAIGVEILHPAQAVLTAVVTGATFLMLVLALVVCFGATGRLLALLLLVLQLAVVGGSAPIETAPRLIQVIHAWLPVTPSAGALSHALSGALEGRSAAFMLALLAVLVASFGMALLGRRRWEFVADEDFKPLISAPMTSRDVPPDPYIDAPGPRDLPERAMHG
ncbi:putative membrane protein [Deinococcus metalli]|uniref:Putative membrane protein n=1 Tax=Deinococcus metalli TaxID=1141878 RepID=A0A7W8KH34_9DEIO|nr:YhgE/Pip family protein [Deinococcus metalli]MBB5376876.1 putative membrane protein [Deinococcus metalli]GHF46005.1 hypothetical protein GCM10017781_23040 [Deinococcus metalli]